MANGAIVIKFFSLSTFSLKKLAKKAKNGYLFIYVFRAYGDVCHPSSGVALVPSENKGVPVHGSVRGKYVNYYNFGLTLVRVGE